MPLVDDIAHAFLPYPDAPVPNVVCALEMVDQFNALGLDVHCVVHATGSAGTQAGLVAGLEGTRSQIPVLGIGVRAPQLQLRRRRLWRPHPRDGGGRDHGGAA